jgi:uncharacterized membrane protein YhaH (DUF805 family)
MEWNLFFGFGGRINRAKCWRVTLLNSFCLVMFFLFVWLNLGVSFASMDPNWRTPLFYTLTFGILGPAFIISMWCFSAIGIKRLHDRDRSGWWMVAFYVVPFLLDKASDRIGYPTVAYIVGLAGAGLSLWGFIEIFCLKGTRGPNRFGSDPLARGNMRIDAGSHAPA